MPNESSTRTNARISHTYIFEHSGMGRKRRTRACPGRVALHHRGAEIGELGRLARRAGVVRKNAAMFRRKAERHGHIEIAECIHLPIEPIEGIGAETVSPREPCTQMANAETLHPTNRIIQPVIFIVEPLTNPERGRVPCETVERELRRAVLAQQTHVEMPVI